MSQLRIDLVPLNELSAETVLAYAWLDRQGQVRDQGEASLRQLASQAKAPVEFFLHPTDSVIARLELPLLPAARITAAVNCAVSTLVLGPSDQLAVVHSARDAQGYVQIAWLQRQALNDFSQLLGEQRIKLKGLYPAAYRLALGTDQQPVVERQGEALLIRHNLLHAEVHPLADEALTQLLESVDDVHWVGESCPEHPLIQAEPSTRRWTGPTPAWGLHSGLRIRASAQPGWGRAAGLAFAALLIWIVGLNLYAAREASTGQQLKTAMVERVKRAFPNLPVILNPLQQTRQQLSGAAATDDPGQWFSRLLQQAGTTIPAMAGQVQQLTYQNGEMQLRTSAGKGKPLADNTWQATLAQAGIEAVPQPQGWLLRRVGEAPQSVVANNEE